MLVPKGDLVRPATDGMRQALFSSLAARVEGASFLDLFSGSGAYGLEALSRGAKEGIFVEKNTKAVSCIRQNITSVCKSLGRSEQSLSIVQADVLNWLQRPAGGEPGLVFIDPPYELIDEIAPRIFEVLSNRYSASSDPVILFEMPGELTLEPSGWTCVKRLGKGVRQPTVGIFRRVASSG